jgi:hypothetical protein
MEVRSDSDCAGGQTRSVCFRGIFLAVWNFLVRRSTWAAALGVLILGLGARGMLIERTRAADRYSEADDLYGALWTQPHTRLSVGGGEIDVVFADGAPGLDRGRVFDWINASARAVTTYFEPGLPGEAGLKRHRYSAITPELCPETIGRGGLDQRAVSALSDRQCLAALDDQL